MRTERMNEVLGKEVRKGVKQVNFRTNLKRD